MSQAPNPGLVGYVAAYYLPQADLLADPVLASPGLVARDLELAPGAEWRRLPFTPNTLKLEETRQDDYYQVRVTAQRPQPDPQVLTALAALDRRPLLLLVEAGGGRRLLGNLDEYLLLATTGEGQNPASKAGVELRFEGQARQRAPYYQGGLPVLGAGALPVLGGAGGSAPAGYVRIQDKKGRLMAQVPAGTVVTISSSFKVVLSF